MQSQIDPAFSYPHIDDSIAQNLCFIPHVKSLHLLILCERIMWIWIYLEQNQIYKFLRIVNIRIKSVWAFQITREKVN